MPSDAQRPADAGRMRAPDASTVPVTKGDAGTQPVRVDAGKPAPPTERDAGCADAATTSSAVEAQLSMGFVETPAVEDDPMGNVDRTLVADARQTETGQPPATIFEGPTDRGTRGSLVFGLDGSLVPEDLIGKKVHVRKQVMLLACDSAGATGLSAEPAVLSVGTLRDAAETLLVLAAPATPTGLDGKVNFFAELAPEFDLRWIDTSGCGHPMLELTVRKTSVKVSAGDRQRREFDLAGQTYVLAVDGIAAPRTTQYCAGATWVVYRKGFFTPAP
jgi:hypothetical protein